MNLLIPYVHLYNHEDPFLEEYTYGDGGIRARKLTKLKCGDYVFFHTSIKGKKYITAYYIVDRVLDTARAIKEKNIVTKYKNPHLSEFTSLRNKDEIDDCILFGDPITSRILERSLLFDKNLANKLSLNIKFPKGKTETQSIGSATRSWRELTNKDVNIILEAIKSAEKEGIRVEMLFSTDEVTEIIEQDLERFIENNPGLIKESLELKRRQLDTPVGRIDLLFENRKGDLIVVELKLNKIGREAVKQLRRYMRWIKEETKKEVKGIVICKGVMPAFEKEFKKLKNIKIFCYGWQLKVYPWR